jgi:hypothetical protein
LNFSPKNSILVSTSIIRIKMRTRILAEILFFALVALGIFAAWFDATCDPGPTISKITNRLIYEQPVVAFTAGMLMMILIWLIHVWWEIRFRYVIAIMVLGICMGHLFWSQDLPFARLTSSK